MADGWSDSDANPYSGRHQGRSNSNSSDPDRECTSRRRQKKHKRKPKKVTKAWKKRLHHFPSSYDSSSETSSDSDYDHNVHTAQHARASTTCLPGICAMGYLVTPGLNEMADNSMSTKTKEWILTGISPIYTNNLSIKCRQDTTNRLHKPLTMDLPTNTSRSSHSSRISTPWASCQIRKIADAHAPGIPGTFSPSPQVSDPDMHHGTCVTHVPWCMPGSLYSSFLWNRRRGKTFPAFPAHAQPVFLRIWQEAHGEGDRLICQQRIHKYTQTDQRPKSLTAWSKRSRQWGPKRWSW